MLALLAAAACGSVNPAPVVGRPLSTTQLKFAVMDAVGKPVYCDPDFYPIAREGGEQANAISTYPQIKADTEAYAAIVAHEHLPSDVTGVRAFNQKTNEFEFRPGPVFAQVLLADEINRASPKTQAALLEAMEEHQVTIDGETHLLPKPFMVMATQNPVEYSGTFPLPEAQLDRFLMKVRLGYLTEKEEANLLNQHKVESPFEELQPVVSPNELKAAQAAVREVFVKPELREYIARLVGRTRNNPEVALGASTRGTLHLFHASQALAAIQGRSFVVPDDIKTLAESVLAHRIILRPNAEMQGQSAGKLVAGLLEREHVPQMAYDG